MENKAKKNSPVAVIDSGVGGISVLKALYDVLPNENYIYFGDSANAPYGERSCEQVREITSVHVSNLIERGAKAIVIACNTATSAAASYLRSKYPDVPIIGMEPAVKPAVKNGNHPTVLVMATALTLREKKFHSLASAYENDADFIFVPCHGLVEMIEQGIIEGEELRELIRGLLKPYVGRADSIVLGCTHYAHVKEVIADIAGRNAKIYDGAVGTARETEHKLCEYSLLNPSLERGKIEIFNSSQDPRLVELSKRLFYR